MFKKKTIVTVVLTIERKNSAKIHKNIDVELTKGETKSIVVKRAGLIWLNEYNNRDAVTKIHDDFELARRLAKVKITGEVKNYKF